MSEKMGFTEDQLADFQEAFLLFDTKGDGRIPVSDFMQDPVRFLPPYCHI
jgi:Ca2+-binding EF-hand superfamily protein